MGDALGQGCIPAKERLGPFGHSDFDDSSQERPWGDMRWGLLQAECAALHFHQQQNLELPRWPPRLRRPHEWLDSVLSSADLDDVETGRMAIVLRAWDGYEYDQNQKAWLRAVITEAALDTGGRFQVFILVHVKDQDLDLSNDRVYKKALEESVPGEFRDLAILFNEGLLRELYSKVSDHGAQDQMYQALQVFSHTFPEYDFVWQIEMDARFTGNVATMLTNAGFWAEQQPRKNLWERNARWFIPGMFSNYSAFSAHVDEEFSDDTGVWGPAPGAEYYIEPRGPIPPDRQQTTWGVGEAADLITFAPIIDPIGSNWTYEHSVHGFPSPDNLPRRMAIVSMTRTSRRLLRLISSEQIQRGVWVVSESTPETWSFLHGLKAVYVPHLFTFNFEDGDMSPEELDRMVHKGPPYSLAGGPKTGFVWCENGMGIPEGRWLSASYFYWAGDAPKLWWEYTNGSCSYPLLLHPVKQG